MVDACPRCKRSFKGPQIPDEFMFGESGPAYYSSIIGVTIRGMFDVTAYWQCPYCGWAWHRFPETDPRWAKIDPWVKEVQNLFPSTSEPSAGEHGGTATPGVQVPDGGGDAA